MVFFGKIDQYFRSYILANIDCEIYNKVSSLRDNNKNGWQTRAQPVPLKKMYTRFNEKGNFQEIGISMIRPSQIITFYGDYMFFQPNNNGTLAERGFWDSPGCEFTERDLITKNLITWNCTQSQNVTEALKRKLWVHGWGNKNLILKRHTFSWEVENKL